MKSVVYHYTSPQGAFDILKNRTLWFTDCQYLNDKGEFVYIRDPLKKAYKKIRQERSEKIKGADDFIESFFASPYEDLDYKSLLRRGQIMRRGYPPMCRYYVLCTSTNEDTANMWHYYVKDGSYRGYNLGLNCSVIRDWFSQLTSRQVELIEGKVVYNPKMQVEMVYNKLKELYTKFDELRLRLSANDDTPAIDEFTDGLFEYINEKKLFFKSPAFTSEEEYRFILKVQNDFLYYGKSKDENELGVKFRVGVSGIITPYIEWNFGHLKANLLKQITLSPMIEPELAKESFKRFLAENVYQNIKIKPSIIKLRF